MASSSLIRELSCSICLSMYKNPVMLACGHNFCKSCIENAWARQRTRQRTSRPYICPECREEYSSRPLLEKNLKLGNIVECCFSVSEMDSPTEGGISCTYCVVSQVPAVKTCIHCEASLCRLHLSSHSRSAIHILIEPTAGVEGSKCPAHNELIKYFCIQDSVPLCRTCTVDGKHKDHHFELLSEASEKKRLGLYEIIKKLTQKTEQTEGFYRTLVNHKRRVQEKVVVFKDQVADLFGDIREKLNKLENDVLSQITQREKEVSISCSSEIQILGRKINELYKRKIHIQQICKIKDPLTLLRQNVDTDTKPQLLFFIEILDEALLNVITMNALFRLMNAITLMKEEHGFHIGDSADLILNVNTASKKLELSYDLKEALDFDLKQKLPPLPERFRSKQVLSTKMITSGKHYWEIHAEFGTWSVGVTYNSVKKKGYSSQLGKNHKSWCISWFEPWNQLSAEHNDQMIDLLYHSIQDIGIYLDYEDGIVSFYDLSDTVEHLYTFHHHFTEPLYFGTFVDGDGIVRILR
ncbi:E3 ubiquitin/ISG15 ligase TRIM25-like [Hyperolius riggenbachi]|uniref:E3 ubiquitin/ISG15 ligase TRIM25-like n=1 Tax=Hyperolius riggenbachi TaxID=752182 RepID=UPI0035A2D658